MGVSPIRIDVTTAISGVEFDKCYADRVTDTIQGVEVDLISLDQLKANRKASGRFRDLDDLDHLP